MDFTADLHPVCFSFKGDSPLPVSDVLRLPTSDQTRGAEGADQTAARQQGTDQRAAQRVPRYDEEKNGLHVKKKKMSQFKCPISFFLRVLCLVAEPSNSVLVKLVLSLLQLCKLAANHPGGADILGIKSNNFLDSAWTVSLFSSLQTQTFPLRGSRQLSGRAGSCGFLYHRPASWQRPPVRKGRVALHRY